MVFDLLGIEIHEMEGAGCCPEPISSQSLSVELWTTLAARNICLAENLGMDIVTLCSGCFETLRTASTLLEEDPSLRDRVNLRLKEIGFVYKGTSEVYHFLEICSRPKYLEKIKSLVKKPLDDINLSAHYGCHLLRPSKILKFESAERPTSMDKILSAIGANTVDSPEKLSCCGECVKLDNSVGDAFVKDKVLDLQENSVDAISVVCPGCMTQLDQSQKTVNKALDEGSKLSTPVIYLSELMALAMGVPQENLSLKKRAIKPTKFIAKIS
jgi:heterodisulfide reductase subunit B